VNGRGAGEKMPSRFRDQLWTFTASELDLALWRFWLDRVKAQKVGGSRQEEEAARIMAHGIREFLDSADMAQFRRELVYEDPGGAAGQEAGSAGD